MFRFTATVFLGFGMTVYGTVFALLSMTEPFYLVPGQPIIAGAMLVSGLLFPILGYTLTTERGQ